jgi:predicted MFS family arabinose efflux permease
MREKSSEFGSRQAWVVCLVGALFFFYTFIQMAILDSLGEPMMRELGLKAPDIAKLASCYFYGNILFLFPAGILLDRISTRKIMLICLAIMTSSTLGLAFVNGLAVAMLCKFIFGLCGAFCLLSCVRLASRWFPPHKLAFVIGVLLMLAMSGSLVAETPFTLLSDYLGWRMSFGVDALIGVVIAAAIFCFVKDSPSDSPDLGHQHGGPSFRRSIFKVLRYSQNWLAGAYTSLMNLPVMIMFVFGSLFLEQGYGFDRTGASLVMMVFLVGVILGCPAFGFISDKWGRRKAPMILASIAALVVIWPLFQMDHLSSREVEILFFSLGFITSAQVISYPLIAEGNPPELTGTAEGVASVLIMLGGFSPLLFAYFLRWHWTPQYINHIPQYGLMNYHNALLLMPISLACALLTAFFLKDSRQKKPRESHS